MEKFIPYEKLSKKEKRRLDQSRRNTWGELNPVTRKPENPKAYNRNKARNWKRDDHGTNSGCFYSISGRAIYRQPNPCRKRFPVLHNCDILILSIRHRGNRMQKPLRHSAAFFWA